MNMKEPAGSDPNRLFFGKIKKEANLKPASSPFIHSVRRNAYSEYSAKSDFEAPQTGHFQSLGMSLNGVPGFMPPSGSPSAGS